MKKMTIRNGVVAALVTALVISPITLARAADTPSLGKTCSAEGISTGTSTDSLDRKSTRLNSSHMSESRMPSSA